PGIGDEIEVAMQQAPQPTLQFISTPAENVARVLDPRHTFSSFQGVTCQSDCARYTCEISESGGNDVLIDLFGNLRLFEVIIEQLFHFGPNHWKKVRSVHYPAAENDPLWRKDRDCVDDALRQVMCFQYPRRMIGHQCFCALAPAFFDCRTRSQPF